eukprot:TRINITY_DN6667_c0_g1_i2.p1 TRINITY_DN6667_c0_g1~~TRINITY_DN6667_c0_g1_i2.p1  ORF type:complete len:329 (-),score=90.04 TRINITY_DN6667_c0_g1_i2:55-1041(-)
MTNSGLVLEPLSLGIEILPIVKDTLKKSDLLISLSLLECQIGNYEVADTMIKESLELLKDSTKSSDCQEYKYAKEMEGYVKYYQGKFDESEEIFKEVIDRSSDNNQKGFFLVNLARMYYQKGDLENAKNVCKESLELLKDSPSYCETAKIMQSRIFFQQKKYYGSLAILDKLAEEIDENRSRHRGVVYSLLAEVYTSLNNIEEAEKCADKSFELIGDSPNMKILIASIHDIKGDIEVMKGNTEEARELFNTSLELRQQLEEKDSWFYKYLMAKSDYHFTKLLEGEGKVTEALEKIEKNLENRRAIHGEDHFEYKNSLELKQKLENLAK